MGRAASRRAPYRKPIRSVMRAPPRDHFPYFGWYSWI